MKRTFISELFSAPDTYADGTVKVCGWVRTLRDSKAFGFVELNDGSYFNGVQIVLEEADLDNYKEIVKLNVGAAIEVEGKFVLTPGMKQPFEIKATAVTVAE